MANPAPAPTKSTQLLSAVGHDLRQPLQALGLWISALRARVTDPSASKIVDRIDASVESLSEMLNTLTEYSRIDAGEVTPEFEIVSVDALLDRAAAQWQARAQSKGLRISVRHSGMSVRSDSTQMGRILFHLLSNAVRFTGQGTIFLCARAEGTQVRIEVRDSGRGIPAEHQARVFERFHRLPAQPADQEKGLGLGLATVRALCDLLEHRSALRSTPGRGSVFSVSAPRVRS